MSTIEVHDLVKVYSGGIRAVDGVDLSVEAGEVFGLLGPNGAGKSTSVKIMTTLLRPTSGTVRVAGHDVSTEPDAVRARIGVALQEAGLDGMMTARETLELQAQLFGVDDPRGRAWQLLQTVGLGDAADRPVKGFSGGMRRRLDLATGLVHRPSILFLDEPTTGLDPASRQAVWDEVRRLNEAGTTIFLTTQYLEEADQLADRIAIVDHGHIVAAGTPAELKASVGHDVVRVTVDAEVLETARARIEALGGVQRVETEQRRDRGAVNAYVTSGPAAVASIVRELDAADLHVGEISLREPSLDDVFLQATGSRLEGAAEQGDAPVTTVPTRGRGRRRRRSA